jgi:hypothetical protein
MIKTIENMKKKVVKLKIVNILNKDIIEKYEKRFGRLKILIVHSKIQYSINTSIISTTHSVI